MAYDFTYRVTVIADSESNAERWIESALLGVRGLFLGSHSLDDVTPATDQAARVSGALDAALGRADDQKADQ
jgi:hypothetical protein